MENKNRRSGVLMHISSLPGAYGIGTFGKEAYNFTDFLAKTNQSIWQLLPLGHTGYGDSPYQCYSAFAGNPLFIDLDLLAEKELLSSDEISEGFSFENTEFDTTKVAHHKYPLLKKASDRFHSKEDSKENFDVFCKDNEGWLDNYSLFISLKKHFNNSPWYEWDSDIKLKESNTVERFKEQLNDEIRFQKTVQYFFFEQWFQLKSYINDKGISIFGDIPLYVAYDSSDVWSHPELFDLDEERNPVAVAGVPPDYFSETGQLWGNPLYNWTLLKDTHFDWWIKRIESNLKIYDILRIDHFRGLSAYWSVPFGEETAVNGTWVDAPGHELFEKIIDKLGQLPIIAEDLGVMTPDVEHLRDRFGFPGMKILQFAFDSSENNEFLPHNYHSNCVVYTGTHDNDTTLGWYQNATEEDRTIMHNYFNFKPINIPRELIRLSWMSVANTAIAPMQDILGLDTTHRMNLPGMPTGYWRWRMDKETITDDIIGWLKEYTRIYQR